jgi:hypothetical protein
MTTITTQLKTELQSRINAITGATSLHDLIKLRSAARGLQLNETVLDTQLTARVAALSPATALDDLFKNALALPVNINPTMIGEIKPFNSGEDTFTDVYGGIWLRAGIITYDTATYPDAQKLPLINNDPSVVTPVAQPNLSGITQKRIASNGSVVVAINPAGTSLTRFTNFTSTGTNIAGTGALSGATWFSITWDERLGLFVMLGRSNLKIVTSPDGSNWSVATVPGGAAAPATNASSLIFAAAARIHLVILNKHYTTTDLVSWAAQTDIASPNGDPETLANRDLRGMVQTPGGHLLLWGAYWPSAVGYLRPFVAVGDTLTLGCTFNINGFSGYADSSITSAAFCGDTDFEISATTTSQPTIYQLKRSSSGVYSANLVDSPSIGDTPTAATNYMGLIIRGGAYITAWHIRRETALPYTVGTGGLVNSALQIRTALSGNALVRLGATFYLVGNSTNITAFDFKWMIGLPQKAPLDGGLTNSVGMYAANFVRIK